LRTGWPAQDLNGQEIDPGAEIIGVTTSLLFNDRDVDNWFADGFMHPGAVVSSKELKG
jgi:hypothetical protein